jgi:hypothetical protein
MDDQFKRRIIPPKSKIEASNIVLMPNVQSLLSDALMVIQTEVARFSGKARKGISLDLREARVLQGYIKALVELSKEAREREKNTDLSEMTPEELLELANALIEAKKKDQSK